MWSTNQREERLERLDSRDPPMVLSYISAHPTNTFLLLFFFCLQYYLPFYVPYGPARPAAGLINGLNDTEIFV